MSAGIGDFEFFDKQISVSRKTSWEFRLSTQLGWCPELTVKKSSDQYYLWEKDEKISTKGGF